METLLIIIASLFVLSWLFLRYLFPRILQWYVNRLFRMQEKPARHEEQFRKDPKKEKEQRKPGIDPDEGEYIDYEEIK